MILEIMIAGTTVAFLGSLLFADRQIKRQRQWEKEDNAPPPPPPAPEPELVIYPFVEVRVGTPCPKCLMPAKDQVTKTSQGWTQVISNATGPKPPLACSDDKCRARNTPHLHAYCYSCRMNWFMLPADSKEKEEETCPQDTQQK